LAKALIMIVRVTALLAIGLGVTMWNSGQPQLLAAHIGVGFFLVALVFLMAVMAILKKAVVPAVLAIGLVVLLPIIGFEQLPLFRRSMGGMQAAHLALALSVIGVAERLYAAMERAG
jgi:hypothetical protein